MTELFTKENITLALALFGSVGALISWLLVYMSQRKRVRISVIGLRSNPKGCFLYMMFENQSRLPISITRMALVDNGLRYDCVSIPKVVIRRTRSHGSEVVERDSESCLGMPIAISSLGAISGHVLFECDRPLLETSATSAIFEVYTNRGKLKQFVIPLSSVSRIGIQSL